MEWVTVILCIIFLVYLKTPITHTENGQREREFGVGYDSLGDRKTLLTVQTVIVIGILIAYVLGTTRDGNNF